ncbi:MAG: 5-(carboxyamino)imidazole ribonucleotide synthase [Actinomycetota bacterium]
MRRQLTIGMVGGGQLGRMLGMAAARLGHRMIVLEPGVDAPAALVAADHLVADYDDPVALDELAARCDVVTYEFENVPVEAARRLAERVTLAPGARSLEVAQDRLVEKRALNDLGIGTAPFAPIDSVAELRQALDDLGGEALLKTRRLGYDGKGQVRVGADDDLDAALGEVGDVPCIAEGLVPFVAEISVIGARSVDGAFVHFDPPRNEHRDGILATSTVPAGVPPSAVDQAVAATRAVLDDLDHVGVLAVELFVLDDGTVLANEIAPRVHNSGHWTEALCSIDQFELHIRAITGAPLPTPTRHADGVMTNLIGDDVLAVADWAADPAVRIHLYGKAEARPGRKMGHVTRVAPLAD